MFRIANVLTLPDPECTPQALQQLRTKLKSAQSLLEQRETDIAQIQSALQSLENEKRKLGESHTTDRFSLSIEVDRLKRDLARCQNELDLAREEVKMNERTRREREGILDKLVCCVLST